jgi:hypothetical protein
LKEAYKAGTTKGWQNDHQVIRRWITTLEKACNVLSTIFLKKTFKVTAQIIPSTFFDLPKSSQDHCYQKIDNNT